MNENILLSEKIKKRAQFLRSQSDNDDISQLLGYLIQVCYGKEEILTNFLDPGARANLKELAQDDFYVQEFGGYDRAEKCRAIIRNDWEYQDVRNFQLKLINITYNHKFATITHSQILGTLVGSGLNLSSLGDIITDGKGKWQFFVSEAMADFVCQEIKRIGKVAVSLNEVSLKQIVNIEDDIQNTKIIVNSLRIDAILAALTKSSRNIVKQLIEKENIKLNWHKIDNSNIIISVNDVLSVRHYGRIEISNITNTRKGKYRLEANLWLSKKKRLY